MSGEEPQGPVSVALRSPEARALAAGSVSGQAGAETSRRDRSSLRTAERLLGDKT